MDLDDLIEDLVPKKKLKKLKKKAKKKSKKTSLLGMILAWLAALFLGDRQLERDRSYDDRSSRERQIQPRASRPVVDEQRREKPKHTAPLYASLDQAYQYQNNIEVMAANAPVDSVERMRLELLSEKVAEWTEMIAQIVDRAVSQQSDPLIEAERKRVPEAIKRLEKQLDKASDPALRKKLASTLENRQRQLAQLEQTANNRQIAELKVENALAQLGIIYSQVHSGRYIAERSGYERLSAEINDEIHTLEDYLDAYQTLDQPASY